MIDQNQITKAIVNRIETNSVGIIKELREGKAVIELYPAPQDENGKRLASFVIYDVPLAFSSGAVYFSSQVGDPVIVFHTKFDSREFNQSKRIDTLKSNRLYAKDNAYALPWAFWSSMVDSLKLTFEKSFELTSSKVKIKNSQSNLIPDLIDAIEKLAQACTKIDVATPAGNGIGTIAPSLPAINKVLAKLRTFGG